METVRGGAITTRHRFQLLGQCSACRNASSSIVQGGTNQKIFDRAQTGRCHLYPAQYDSAVIDATSRQSHRESKACQRKISVSSRNFVEAESPLLIEGANSHVQ